MGNLSRYWHTLRHLRPEQILYRIPGKLHLPSAPGWKVSTDRTDGPIALLKRLDFDPGFLARFPAETLLENRITLLHESQDMDWNGSWEFPDRSPLWNFNLHYFEYLFPLVHGWLETRQPAYLDKFCQIITGWIRQNPKDRGGAAWDPYTLSLRLVNWLSCYGYLRQYLEPDFEAMLLASLKEQYAYLASHPEKHLLGNHYFENLKTLVICSLFFRDQAMTDKALGALKKQCQLQILPDGMHFELSPMYQKIILEDLLRTAAALALAGQSDAALEAWITAMIDASYSLEEGLDRVPLFNDCGNNIAKSLDALTATAEDCFGVRPSYRSQLPDSGYYIFKSGPWKLIVDAGQPGPDYLPGHAHCDAMSFELFFDGKPILVNCGTYAYQSKDRLTYKNTAAHNTVMRRGVEQSQCWGSFRMARRAQVRLMHADSGSIGIALKDQLGGVIHRSIRMDADGITLQDSCPGGSLDAFLHCAVGLRQEGSHWITKDGSLSILCSAPATLFSMDYAPEFGVKSPIPCLKMAASDTLSCCIRFCEPTHPGTNEHRREFFHD